MNLNLSSQISIEPVHGENSWLNGKIDWNMGLLRSALIWLSEKTGKSILKLTDKDYQDNSLTQLLDIYGSAYDVNIRVFNIPLQDGPEANRMLTIPIAPKEPFLSRKGLSCSHRIRMMM